MGTKIKFCSFIVILHFTCQMINAQDTITVSGVVTDHYSQQRLPYANVSIKGTYIGTSTNEKGKFYLKIPENFLPVEIAAGYMGYQDTAILITKTRNQNIDISLYPKSIDLYEVTVNSEKNVVFGDRNFQVLDFLVLEERILLMYYKGKLSRSVLVMTDLLGKTLSAIPIKGKPIQLYTDCTNTPFLVCQSLPYIIHVKDSSVTLQRAYQDRFNKLMKPCVASIDKTLYYKYMGPFDLSVKYYKYDLKNQNFELFTQIDDEFQQNMFISDFNHLLRSNGIKIMGNTKTYDALTRFRQVDLQELFRYNMFHHSIYAPLFTLHDSVLIFDHPNNQLLKFDMDGNCFDTLEICYNNIRGWQPQILFDQLTEKFYTTVVKGSKSTFYEIDIKSGQHNKVAKLRYDWIEKPEISNNTIYFIIRRKDKNAAKYLYYEDLKATAQVVQ